MANPSDTRRRIIETAAKVFHEKGYHAATIQDIADEVGLLKGSLYYHIASKEQLLAEVIVSTGKEWQAGVDKIARSDVPAHEKLRQAIRWHLSLYATHRDEASVLLHEVPNVPQALSDEIRASQLRYEETLLGIIKAGIASGEFRADLHPRMTLYAILGMCNWIYKWYRQEGPLSAAEIGGLFSDLILRGMRPLHHRY